MKVKNIKEKLVHICVFEIVSSFTGKNIQTAEDVARWSVLLYRALTLKRIVNDETLRDLIENY